MKVKKYSLFISAMIAISNMVGSTIFHASAMELTYDEIDQVFIQSVSDFLGYENYPSATIQATKDYVYDVEQNDLGFVYDFTVNNTAGYAIVINTSGYFEVAELCFDSVSPYGYNENVGNIYLGNMQYLYVVDNSYYLCDSDIEVDITNISDDVIHSYYGESGGTLTATQETIYFSTMSQNSYDTCYSMPRSAMAANGNTCAPLAALNIIQYYDRFFPSLIEDYTPGVMIGTNYIYWSGSSELDGVSSILGNYMGNSGNSSGTTINQFKTGLNRYVTEKNRNIIFNSCMSLGNINFNSCMSYLNSDKPIVLFVRGYSIASLTTTENSVVLSYLSSNNNHVMVAFGYNEITYILNNGRTRIDKFLHVSSGINQREIGYYNINYNTNIDDCYAVTIF